MSDFRPTIEAYVRREANPFEKFGHQPRVYALTLRVGLGASDDYGGHVLRDADLPDNRAQSVLCEPHVRSAAAHVFRILRPRRIPAERACDASRKIRLDTAKELAKPKIELLESFLAGLEQEAQPELF